MLAVYATVSTLFSVEELTFKQLTMFTKLKIKFFLVIKIDCLYKFTSTYLKCELLEIGHQLLRF